MGKDLNTLTWLASAGGPLLLLPGEYLAAWEGTNPPSEGRILDARFRWGDPAAVSTDYDRACDVAEYLGLLDVGGGQGLVLGDAPLATAWLPDGDSGRAGMLVRWVSADNEVQILVALAHIPDHVWDPAPLLFPAGSTPLYLFDAAIPGSEVDNYLTLDLDPGSYLIHTAIYKPDDSTELILHRFRRR
ncbi:MAG TPA: Imm21 family immunity protein [Chloroflexia bacterium]|nr:Imm21 family immunity protein [Chloroflexia bacterium]